MTGTSTSIFNLSSLLRASGLREHVREGGDAFAHHVKIYKVI